MSQTTPELKAINMISEKCVIGGDASAANNIKIKRAGNGLLQFVLGNDTSNDGEYSSSYADVLGTVPVGTIVAWNPGYYTNDSNNGYNSILITNNVTSANSYLNPRGYYVADGDTPNVTGSLIWNNTTRRLPNISDSCFLMGNTILGSKGGSNTMLDHIHTQYSLTAASTSTAHVHNIVHSHTNTVSSQSTTHTHSFDYDGFTKTAGPSTYLLPSGQGAGLANTTPESVNHQHTVTVNNFTGNSQAMSANSTHTHSVSGTIGSENVVTSTENRPNYLSTFYIVRVF